LVGLAGVFLYRYLHLGGIVYLAYVTLFAGLVLAGAGGWLAARWQNLGLNLGVSLLFLDFVFAEINLAEFGQALARANYWYLLPATLCVLVHLFFRTVRWQWLLKPLGEVSFWAAFRALVIGIAGNTILPARAGEFLRAYVLGRSTGLPKTGVFATLVVERIFDGLTVLFLFVVVVILGVRHETLQQAGLVMGAVYVGAMVAVVLFITKRHWADALIVRFLPLHLTERMAGLLDDFVGGLAVLKKPRQLAMVTFWNFFTWAVVPVSFWFTLLAFDFGTPVPWQAPVLMLPALAFALTIPGAPGGVGLVQFATKLTLNLTFAGLAVATNFNETVAAAGIVIHISQLAPEVIPGIISFAAEGLSVKEVAAGQPQK
jgi:hypothetical protein